MGHLTWVKTSVLYYNFCFCRCTVGGGALPTSANICCGHGFYFLYRCTAVFNQLLTGSRLGYCLKRSQFSHQTRSKKTEFHMFKKSLIRISQFQTRRKWKNFGIVSIIFDTLHLHLFIVGTKWITILLICPKNDVNKQWFQAI